MKPLIVSVLIVGSLYTVQAIAFVLVIRATGALNFAQGQILALSAYFYHDALQATNGAALPALAYTVCATGVLCLVLYRVVLVRLEGSPLWATVIALFGVGIIITAARQIYWGSTSLFVDLPVKPKRVEIGGFVTNRLDVLIFAGCMVLTAAILLVVYATPLGLRMRACAENRALASYGGISVLRIGAVAWVLAGVALTFAGVGLALRSSISPDLESAFLTAFPAVIIGGYESLSGAVAGSFLLAFVIAAVGEWSPWGSAAGVPAAYTLLFMMLIARPHGLFGTRQTVRI